MIGCALEIVVTPLGVIVGVVVGVAFHLVVPAFLYVVGSRINGSRSPSTTNESGEEE